MYIVNSSNKIIITHFNQSCVYSREGGVQLEFTKVEDKQRKFFDENGYLTVPNALDPDMLKEVTAGCDRVVDQQYKESGKRRASLINVLPEDDVFKASCMENDRSFDCATVKLSHQIIQITHYL